MKTRLRLRPQHFNCNSVTVVDGYAVTYLG